MDFLTAKKIFDDLYKKIDGYSLSFKGRQKNNLYTKELTYGEIKFESFYEMLKKIDPKENEIFYDLGSGTGKPVIAATLLFNFKKSIGIEILEELYQASLMVKYNCLNQLKRNNYQIKSDIDFILKDIIDADFFDGDVIFVNSTCFSQNLIDILETKFLKLKKGTRIIMLTKVLSSNEKFHLIDSSVFSQGWGDATVNFYVVK